MPDDRFLHRRCLHSRKVSGLTHLEHRVWTTYLLAADDYGVMRFSAAALQSANDALEHAPTKALGKAFQRLVDVGLNRLFEFQGKAYIYQHDWQLWQHISRPRKSLHPLPPLELIDGCEETTQALMKSRLEASGAAAEVLEFPEQIRASDTRDTTLTATSLYELAKAERQNGNTAVLDPRSRSEIRDRFDRFWEAYPRKVGRGAAWRVWLKLKPDDVLTDTMLDAIAEQIQSPQWRKDGGQFVPHPTTWLNQERWLDSAAIDVQPQDGNDWIRGFVRG